MPPDRTSDTNRRQRDPQSCHSCRSKKLKCDRQRPCSNCTTRRIVCDYGGQRPTGAAENGAPNDDGDLHAQNLALKARIERLEQAVFREQSAADVPTATPTRSPIFADANGERAAHDVQWLEGIGNRIADMLPNTAETAQVTVLPQNQFLHTAMQSLKLRPISLPPLDVSLAYLSSYERDIDSVQPIMHIASTRTMIENAYTKLQAGHSVHLGSIALILAVCAYVELWELGQNSPFSTTTPKIASTTILAEQALFAFENACLASQISVELVQAAILLIFHFGHLEGISFQPRQLHSRAIAIARTLGLHMTDMTSAEAAEFDKQAGVIDREVRRRVWWHLVSTDWLFAYMDGPHEGTYSIQPQQMAVNHPRNIANEDLNSQGTSFRRTDDEPTVMTFYLQRIKLATICREAVDFLSNNSPSKKIIEVPYDKVISFDANFAALINGLPKSLRLDTDEEIGLSTIEGIHEQMAIQRLLTNLLIHTKRCRLHIPFLIRYKADLRYTLSRQICLEAARKVFQAWRRFQINDGHQAYTATLRLGSIFGHVLLATTIMVIDFCVNRPNFADEEQFAEVRRAIKTAEDARESSRIASAFWDSLTDVLRQHQVHLPSGEPTNRATSNQMGRLRPSPEMQDSNFATYDAQNGAGSGFVSGDAQATDCGDSFDDIWQQLLENQNLTDPQNWDAFLNDLDLRAA